MSCTKEYYKTCIMLRLVIIVIVIVYLLLKDYNIRSENHLSHFKDYTKRYNRSYDDEEYLKRKQYYEDSLIEISRLNALHGSPVFGVNKFSDLSPEERGQLSMDSKHIPRCIPLQENTCPTPYREKTVKDTFTNGNNNWNLPLKVDWRDKGVVGPILNQKRCRGCWAFSIVGVMESMWAIMGNGFHRLSIQEVIDCSTRTSKCAGGGIGVTLQFLCVNDYPIVDTKAYPLMLVNEECKMPRNLPHGRRIAEFSVECNMNEWQMLQVIANHGPVLAAVNSNPWPFYSFGIISKACDGKEQNMNHVIQIVGYDRTAEIPYYIVRNNWGDDFGENGYLKIAMFNNVCGIANNVAYLSVK